ncbi:ABC transporter ATP-binding protein [Plantactinospora sp. B5E13]|uniref:ABC transporter ATP-binding protein n=1 Tax=unclassified Plantactinospora TaxID=2631981 RepID=UPI00325F242A
MTDVVLRFTGVSRTYRSGDSDVRALDGVSFDVEAGELVAVMGPSGSGKSTLLALAGGLDTPTRGAVEVEGTALTDLAAVALARLRRDRIGYVFQDYNLVNDLTAAENVALPRELAGVRPRAARREAIAALARVGLGELAHRFPDQLSGGQQQRIAIARALIGQRRLVLADEPTGALDSETGEAVLEVLRAHVDAGAAGVLVTHEPRYAGWADRTIFLRDGRLIDSTGPRATPDQLLGGRA